MHPAILFLLILGNQSNPSWVTGIWSGNIGWEHDTTEYVIQIELIKSRNIVTITFPQLGKSYQGKLVKSDSSKVRYKLQREIGDSLLFNQGSFDLIKVATFPKDYLQIQFYPFKRDQLWIGQLKKSK